MKSFKRYQYRRIPTDEGLAASGDYIFPDVTVRLKDGYLNDFVDEEGHVLPAIETHDGTHIEHWHIGVLHFIGGPAIIDKADNYEEWYEDGNPVPKGGSNEKANEPGGV